MERALTFEDVRRAWEAKDTDLAGLIVALASEPDPTPAQTGAAPPREGAPTLSRFVAEITSPAFRRKKAEEQAHYRIEGMKALESPSAEQRLPDRMRVGEIILALWAADGAFERDVLLSVIAGAPLKWGPWRAFKRIFKEAESRGDWEIYGALAARFDAAFAAMGASSFEINRRTFAYLVRRAWRTLRRQAESLPVAYADAAVDVLRFYDNGTRWSSTWVYNHIVFHETKKYTRRRFYVDRRHTNLLQHRYSGELWRRTPRPLFTLLERARSEQARSFAIEALKADFRASLREVEPSWAARLVSVESAAVHDFVVWLFTNVPRFELGKFRELGLHEPVLRLCDSPSQSARVFAASYARTHARDLPTDELIRLINNTNEEVRKLARDLIADRDPRKDVGLEGWGRLLGTSNGHELAAAALRKHFGAKELSPEWFKERLVSPTNAVFQFAAELFPKIHAAKDLGAGFYAELLDDERLSSSAARFALDALARFPEGQVELDVYRRALLHPLTSQAIVSWIDTGRIAPKDLGVAYLKALAYKSTWESDPFVTSLKKSGRAWARDLEYSERLRTLALKLLSDVRKFSPDELGFGWLMQLAGRSEKEYADFAVEYMIKAFVPADFAPKEEAQPSAEAEAAAPAQVDLKGQSFLFTGKLATMQRGDATKKVASANGKNASGVNAKLDYLVIGDEGSPLYGAGRKGSKQLAAEKLVAAGAPIKIISETAFLQMLAGSTRSFSEDTSKAGAERLWTLLTEPGPEDAPLRQFALRYIRRHHPDISLELTDRPVDPGAEVPAEFLTFERVKPLFFDTRAELRAFALELARWELARWAPPIEGIVQLAEAPHAEVRGFVAKALLAGDEKEHARYRVDPKTLTPDAVYSFCESLDPNARALGMKLIAKHPRLAVPEELFRLSESPDRQVRAFVIKVIWSLYRDKGVTRHWKPAPPPATTVGKKAAPAKAAATEATAAPLPAARPEKRPAGDEALRDLLRRALFSVPPGRLPKASAEPSVGESDEMTNKKSARRRARPLPARKAKLYLVEALRDLALEDAAFAAVITPLLEEFLASRGASERAACLVALTRIRKAHPSLPKEAA